MAAKKSLIKWRVMEAPTGPFRSFQRRGWPKADYCDMDNIAAMIECDDDYIPAKVKAGKHGPLRVRIADYRETPWKWRYLKASFATLQEAKDGFSAFIKKNPEFMPKTNV